VGLIAYIKEDDRMKLTERDINICINEIAKKGSWFYMTMGGKGCKDSGWTYKVEESISLCGGEFALKVLITSPSGRFTKKATVYNNLQKEYKGMCGGW
jgi:hypothetical protein